MAGASRASTAGTTRERLALLAVVIVPQLFFVTALGFYTDDWAFLSQLAASPDQSVGGLYGALGSVPQLAVRPLQILLYLFYYKIAPGSVLFPHLFNLGMQAAAAMLLHSALRKIDRLRPVALVLTAIYFALPDFAAMKMWYANHMSTLSLLFFAVALRLVTGVLNGDGNRFPGSVRYFALAAATAASVLSYELLSFILLAAPIALSLADGRPLRALPRDPRVLKSTAAILAGFLFAAAFKIMAGDSMVQRPHGWQWLQWSREIYVNAAWIEFVRLGAGLPLAAWRIAQGPWFAPLALVPAVLAPTALWGGLARRKGEQGQAARPMVLLLLGAAAFVAGYLPFLVSYAYGPAAFGVGSRDNVAGAFGVTIMMVAVFLWLDGFNRAAARTAVTIVVGCGVFIQVTEGLNWAAAWQRQQATYAALARAVPDLKEGDTLLLYGICPYDGSAQGYSSAWGLGDRLRAERGLARFNSDTITGRSSFDAAGITTREYSFAWQYPYGAMLIWDVRGGQVHAIRDYPAARTFFAAHPITASAGCTYVEGEGEPLF